MQTNFIPVAYHKTILLLLIAALGLFILFVLRNFISSILGAILIYTLFKPVFDWMHTKKKIGNGISAFLVILISFLIIVIPFIGACIMMVERIGELRQNPAIITDLVEKINGVMGRFVHDDNFLQHRLPAIQQGVVMFLSKLLSSFFSTVITILIMYFILYFMLTDSVVFENTLSRFLPIKAKGAQRLGLELRNITYSNIFGQGIIAIVQSICVISCFLVFGIPDPFFWGIISAFLSFIPMFGLPSVFIAASILSFLSHNYVAGVGILLWGIVVLAVVENFLRLYLARRIANVHPLITVIGVLIGLPTFGIVGIVFGPLLFSYFILLVSIYQSQNSTGEPDDEMVKKQVQTHQGK